MKKATWSALALTLTVSGSFGIGVADPKLTCLVEKLPAVRTAGDLTVESPPRPRKRPGGTRLRSHVEGPLGPPPAGRNHPSYHGRRWAGPEVPSFVPLLVGTTQELFVLDKDATRYMALYRDPYGAGSCDSSGTKHANCAETVRIYDCAGTLISDIPLAGLFSKPDGLELQDVRLSDNTIYFNEACQSYSKENAGKCSALVAVDITTKKVVWRTKDLVSNSVMLVDTSYIITGYGFTNEPGAIFLVRRSDGAIVANQAIEGHHDSLTYNTLDHALTVGRYEGSPLVLSVAGLDGTSPALSIKSSNR